MALGLYVNAFQTVLANSTVEDSWSRVYGSLCCLRQSLLCSVCEKLLLVPYHPADAWCEHNFCQKCIEGRKPQCECCTVNPDFQENVQMRLVLQCFKRMCQYILSSAICRNFKRSKLTSPMLRFISMVHEGAGQRDIYYYTCSPASVLVKKLPKLNPKSNSESENTKPVNGQRPLYSLKLHNVKSSKVMKKSSINNLLTTYAAADGSDDSEVDCPKVLKECMRSVNKTKGCRCGMTKQPGNQRCFDQHCPCYMNGRACINCRCKGCRNPQKNLINSPPYRSSHPDHNASDEEIIEIDNENNDSSDEVSFKDSGKQLSI